MMMIWIDGWIDRQRIMSNMNLTFGVILNLYKVTASLRKMNKKKYKDIKLLENQSILCFVFCSTTEVKYVWEDNDFYS